MNFPKRVTVELTNRCNRACAGCPRHQMTYPQGDMNETLFRKIISELPQSVVVVPFFRGESTLHPRFCEWMRCLRGRTVQLASNGDNLTKEVQRAIMENVTFLSLSLHEPKLPEQTSWLSFLYDCVGAGIETQVSIVESVLPKNKTHFVEEWYWHVNRLRIYQDHSANGFGSMNGSHPTEACTKPFEEMVVYWDGKVGLCNHDWNNSTPLGDLNMGSIAEVWNDSKYKAVRAFHGMQLRKQVESCKSCDFQPRKIYGELIQCR